MLEPQSREQLVDLPAAPPVVDLADERRDGRPRSAVGGGSRRSSRRHPGDDRRRRRTGAGRGGRRPRRGSRAGRGPRPRSARTATARAARARPPRRQWRPRPRPGGAPAGGARAPNRSPAPTPQPIAPATTTRPHVKVRTPPSRTIATAPTHRGRRRRWRAARDRRRGVGRVAGGSPFLGGAVAIRRRVREPPLAGGRWLGRGRDRRGRLAGFLVRVGHAAIVAADVAGAHGPR